MQRVLVIGKSGQLARCLADELPKWPNIQAHFFGYDDWDIREQPRQWHPVNTVLATAVHGKAEAIINTAAFHDLRACEADFDTAAPAINAVSVELIGDGERSA